MSSSATESSAAITSRADDWRFLLVRATSPDDADERKVVRLRGPSKEMIEEAVSALAPGGTCYAELSATGARRGIERLRRSGLVIDAQFGVWPPPHRGPRWWFPLHRRDAIGHFLATRPLPSGALARVRTRAIRVAGRAALRIGTVPTAVFAHKPGASALQPAECIMLTPGDSELNKVVQLRLSRDSPEPSAALKIARSALSAKSLEREAAILQRLFDSPDHDCFVVPRVLSCDRSSDRVEVAETVVEGRPVQELLTPKSFEKIATRIADGLLALTRFPPTAPESKCDVVYAAFENRFAGHIDRALLRRVRNQLRTLPPLPTATEQRDCAP
ncbi:MAG TPA: hypothetical protein VFR41_08210, partial [Acidimicrobiia bacterium]|nr:hypothetical protein [Acidimicrobiia bacterium]